MVDTLRILVVDDEAGMRLGVARALRDFTVALPDVNGQVRFAVEQADSGEQALETIRVQPPDILLLDHKLPGISGLEVLEGVGQHNEMLTVMITAYATLETAVAATKRGAYDFLAKPFTPEELRSTVRKAAARLVLAKQARRLAVEKRQVRFQFISVLAHELKSPLAAIEGYLHIVRDRSAGDDQAVYGRMIDRCLVRSEQMRKLIGDLLDMTRIESGQKRRDLAEVDLTELARAAVETAGPSAAERGIAIGLEAPACLPMLADRGEIEMILNNLISNAIKYNRDRGRVELRLRAEPEARILTVADSGIGMTAEECQRLFTDFYRARNEKTRNILGSGLGLSIVRKLAALYGGQVSVASRPEVGSTFTVTLKTGAARPEQISDTPAETGGGPC